MPLIDLSTSKINPSLVYGGSDQKFGIIYNGKNYLIKFQEKVAPQTELGTSYINNCVSEDLGSRIAISCGLPAHHTFLAHYKDELVVACEDFRNDGDVSREFAEYMRMQYSSKDIGKHPKLEQIYDVIENNPLLSDIQAQAIQRYWDTFAIDALLANFDRHKGNWGYIYNIHTEQTRLAPAYDFGSTLFPKLSEDGMVEITDSPDKTLERIRWFPTAALLVNGTKVSYYDMIASGYDKNCTASFRNIMRQIDMDNIHQEVENTPIISGKEKDFYHHILNARYEYLMMPLYERLINRDYDKTALERIKTGTPYSQEIFSQDIERGKFKDFDLSKEHLSYKITDKKETPAGPTYQL